MVGDDQSIGELLKDLMYEIEIETLTGKTADLIISFNKQFKDSKKLTDAQEKVLRQIYNDFMR